MYVVNITFLSLICNNSNTKLNCTSKKIVYNSELKLYFHLHFCTLHKRKHKCPIYLFIKKFNVCNISTTTFMKTLLNVLIPKIKWENRYIPILLPKPKFKIYLLSMLLNQLLFSLLLL
jgi:hypothetical protein